MASMKYHKDCKRWRVFWHVTLANGEVEKGSRSFKEKTLAQQFKEHVEKREKQLKKTVFVEAVFLDDAIEEWEVSCLGYSEQTKKLYTREVEKFIEFLGEKLDYISDLETIHITSYMNHMLSRGVSKKTVNNALCAIKSLCRYIRENYKIQNPAEDIKKLKTDDVEANFWNEEEYRKVLINSPDFVRDWIRFIANTGLRASEFCGLKWRNCDFRLRSITVIGKGSKRRTIGLNDVALGILNKIKTARAIEPDDRVFLNKNKPMTRYMLGWYVGEACRNAGLTGGGPHAARHYFATELLLAGKPTVIVSALLGHSSTKITEGHYSHILPSDLSDATYVLKAI